MTAVLTRGLLAAIRAYQLVVSPWFGPGVCRFFPSCSEYALAAIAHEGAVRGSWKALRRLGRCSPLHPGGVDFP